MFLLYMLDRDESIDTRLRELQHILELETHIIYVGGIPYASSGACHMYRTLWEKGGYTLDDTMRRRNSYRGKTILEVGWV